MGSYGGSALSASITMPNFDAYLQKIQDAGNNVDEVCKAAVNAALPIVQKAAKEGAERHRKTGDVSNAIEVQEAKIEGNLIVGTFGIDMPIQTYWYGIAYGAGRYIAIGNNAMATSLDSITWTYVSASGGIDVIFANNMFAAVGSNFVRYSTNGTSWTTVTTTVPAFSIAYGGGKYVVAPNGSSTGLYSSDGVNWYTFTLSDSITTQCYVAYGNGRFVLCAGTAVYYSTNGSSWTALSAAPISVYCIYNAAGYFVIVGSGKCLYYSTNGSSWTAVTMPNTDYGYLESVVYDGLNFWAVSGTYTSNTYTSFFKSDKKVILTDFLGNYIGGVS